jgi:nitrate/TMAO reductase-like tetraheme cytochrome c subunit
MLSTAYAASLPQLATRVLVDTTRSGATVRTPLPGGVGTFVRTALNAPAWLQIAVIAIGVLTFLGLMLWAWLNLEEIGHWFGARSRGWKIAFAGLVVLVAGGFGAFAKVSWDYTQHNNDFCIGCHVMGTAWTRFQHSEHHKLKCHDCHQQSIFASMRQLYLWVAERPASIPPHAKVPTNICLRCHNQDNPDSTWKRIIATSGHSVHLRNDKPALRNVQCVTCHGAEVHHFVPVDRTCGQAGCHENVHIALGKMAGQSSLHCTGCHQFTAEVAENVSPDSARTSLVPTGQKCLDCHQMKQRLSKTLADFEVHKEPHKAVCGACHDPHKQTNFKQAFESCQSAGCHTRPDTLTPFHRGLPNGALQNCGSCHKAHAWKVASKDCTACHRDIDRRSLGTGPPDTTQFRHAEHKYVPCTSCHSSERSHGEVTLTRPSGCQGCHHSPTQKVACATCHTTLASAVQTIPVSMTVWTAARERSLPFAHERHGKVACRTCHTTPVTLAPQAQCASCHDEHHNAQANCQSCHPAKPVTAQREHPRIATHTAGCSGSGCHKDASLLRLQPTRNVCLACHRDQVEHKPGGDCAACHRVTWRSTSSAASSNGGAP